MKKLVFHFILILIVSPAMAQPIINRDPEISRMVDEMSIERIEDHIKTLVSFHTRHNLSSRDNPSRGIGAAWNWVKAEMEKSIPASQGRLEVKFTEYTAGGKGQRITYPVKLKNVVATLIAVFPGRAGRWIFRRLAESDFKPWKALCKIWL